MATNCEHIFSIGDYIRGSVRGLSIPDISLMSICSHCSLEPSDYFSEVSEKDRELTLAWTYVWIAGGPTQTGSSKDSDADWSHSEGGERMSANTLKRYLDMANEIFDKYDEPLVGDTDCWGFVGHGFHNPRKIR